MSDYVVFADSSSDISTEQLKEWGIENIPMAFRFDGSDEEYRVGDIPIKEFYDRMRRGGVARTSALNPQEFLDAFEPVLAAGKDVLYIPLTGGLSTTYANANDIAGEELREKYPDRKFIVLESACVSGGMALYLYLLSQKRKEGATLEELVEYALELKPHLCHWFTVDSLTYLRRGGRISATTAIAGNALGIKPIMHVDMDGHLINMDKVRGRKASLRYIADKYTELAIDPKAGPVFIGHGDCMEDAQALAAIIKAEHGVDVTLYTDIGPIIGAHLGPGGLTFFFQGKER